MTDSQGRSDPVLCPGRNCRLLSRFNRLAFLIDGRAYFEALIDALPKARQRIVIVGWDFDGRTPLRPHVAPERPDSDEVMPLGRFLRGLVEQQPELEIHVLIWRNSIFYGSNPIPVSLLGPEWWEHPRIHFRLDDHHPLGASHHQKIVCIDDKLAFLGGMDLTQGRWDDTDHTPEQPARVDTFGKPYPPVHDVQVAVDGEAATAIAAIVSDRWRYVTGETLAPIAVDGDPWPQSVAPMVRDRTIAVARTQPAHGDQPAVREIEALNAAILEAANDYIYIETQYFSLPLVADILVRHLQRPDGPEVVLVVTRKSSGMIEQYVMAENRDRIFKLLRGSDPFGRLRMYFPVSCPDPMCEIKIHSKLFFVDDRLLKAGSSNLNARSLGLDTETDLAFVAESDDERRAIRNLRDTLLAEHLGVDTQLFAQTFDRCGSLIVAVEALNRPTGRRLVPYIVEDPTTEMSLTPGSSILDPSQPIDLGYVLGKLTNSQ
jgi:phosphatidylserine/phosphatidylglycerophosphate/cardiolipin synthase-like enzyme